MPHPDLRTVGGAMKCPDRPQPLEDFATPGTGAPPPDERSSAAPALPGRCPPYRQDPFWSTRPLQHSEASPPGLWPVFQQQRRVVVSHWVDAYVPVPPQQSASAAHANVVMYGYAQHWSPG